MKISLDGYGTDGVLVTQDQAQKARANVEKAIAKQTPGTPIELSFDGVVAVSSTFADECLGRVLSSRLAGYDEDFPLLVTGANREVRATIASALRPRRLAVLSISQDGVELLGADATLDQTIRAAVDMKGTFTATDIARELGLSPQAANNRLIHLLRVGALRRERVIPSRAGREFRYQVPEVEFGTKRRTRRPATTAIS